MYQRFIAIHTKKGWKTETGLRTIRAGTLYALLLRAEAIRIPTLGFPTI